MKSQSSTTFRSVVGEMKNEICIKEESTENYVPEETDLRIIEDNLSTFKNKFRTKSALNSNAMLKLKQNLRSKSIKDILRQKYKRYTKNPSSYALNCKVKSRKTTSSRKHHTTSKDLPLDVYNSISSIDLSYQSIKEYVVSCRFCKISFTSIAYFHNHECRSSKIVNPAIHKCRLCSSVFKHKNHLDKHLKGHNRNNCRFCTAQLTTRKALYKHLKNVHDINEFQKLYKCSFCEKAFAKRSSLNSHLKNHAEGKFLCLKCGFMCEKEENFLNHMKEHIETVKFKCVLCDKEFVRGQQFDQHMMGHQRHLCSLCDVTFSTKKMLLKHQQSLHGVSAIKKHECPICKKLFVRPIHLKVHLRIHTGEKPVMCCHCKKNFTNEQSLAKHMKTARHLQNVNDGKKVEVLKPFLCAICGATFFRQQSLQRHIETIHSIGETHKCPHCDYNTKCKANLKRHIEGHSNIKRYVCEICGASFRAFGTLKEHHTFVHSESRSFMCDTCNKAFKNKSGLQRHLRIHREDRPYRCHCSRDYKRLSHLKRHLVSAHQMTAKRSFDCKRIEIHEVEKGSFVKMPAIEKNSLLSNGAVNSYDSPNKDSAIKISELTIQNTSNLEKGNIDFDMRSTAVDLLSYQPTVLSDSQDSVSLEYPSLNIPSNNFLNFAFLSPSPKKGQQGAHSEHFVEDNTNRPRSLPNFNSQTSNDKSLFPFSMHNSDLPSSMPPDFLLESEQPTPCIQLNSSPKKLFGEPENVLDVKNVSSDNKSFVSPDNSENYFIAPRNDDSWFLAKSSVLNTYQNAEIAALNYEKAQSPISEFPVNLSSNFSPLMACNLVFPDDPLMECTIDTDSFNTDALLLS